MPDFVGKQHRVAEGIAILDAHFRLGCPARATILIQCWLKQRLEALKILLQGRF